MKSKKYVNYDRCVDPYISVISGYGKYKFVKSGRIKVTWLCCVLLCGATKKTRRKCRRKCTCYSSHVEVNANCLILQVYTSIILVSQMKDQNVIIEMH